MGLFLKKFFFNWKVWGLMIGFIGYGYIFNLLFIWFLIFFKYIYGMDFMLFGLFIVVLWLILIIFGIVVGGWFVDYFIKKGYFNIKVY